jgi:hypothetical protein
MNGALFIGRRAEEECTAEDERMSRLRIADIESQRSTAEKPASGGPTVEQASPADVEKELDRLSRMLERGQVEEARRFANELQQRWPESDRARVLARVIAPPTTRIRPETRSKRLDRERAWLREHSHEYPGRWLAVSEGRLIAADPSLHEVLAEVRKTVGEENVLLHREGERRPVE